MDTRYGYCKCGCGQKTKINNYSRISRGQVEGEPRKYLYRHGKVDRTIVVQPEDRSIKHIPLTNGQFCIVDSSRYEELMQWAWMARWNVTAKSWYAYKNLWLKEERRGIVIFMHQYLKPVSLGFLVDHKNRNSLDNRVENLLERNKSQNAFNSKMNSKNTSGTRGVSRSKVGGFEAYITYANKRFNLGRFKTIEQAISIRKNAEIKLFGEEYLPTV